MGRKKTKHAAGLGFVCIAVLLLTTVAQTAHFCGFQVLETRSTPQVRQASPGTTLCLTCLMAQAGAAVTAFSTFLPSPHKSSPLCWQQMQSRPFLHAFQMYDRPPPAC